MVVSVWQKILEDLEDCRAATVLTAIDYAKAFNRMQYQDCLRALARHGAPDQIIGMVATFLSERSMTVRVGRSWSDPRPVNGGVPQGSILGVILFNITTDNLEDKENAIGYEGPITSGRHERNGPSLADLNAPSPGGGGGAILGQRDPYHQSTPCGQDTAF